MSEVVYRNLGELVKEAKKKYPFKRKDAKPRKNYPMDNPKSKVSSTGLYRVRKIKSTNYSQGFCYAYIFYINGKRKQYSSVDILKLKRKVKNAGEDWKIIDKQKVLDLIRFHNLEIDDIL